MNNKKSTIIIVACIISITTSFSQNTHLSSQEGELSFGLGIGLPYGAIGVRFGKNVIDGLNLYGGIGYQFVGIGYSLGVLKDFKSNSATQFYINGMYGSNAAIKVVGLEEYDKIYVGPSFGFGIKVNSRRKEGNFWDIGLLVPFRSSSFQDDIDVIKNDPRVAEFKEASPVLIVLGYNFNL